MNTPSILSDDTALALRLIHPAESQQDLRGKSPIMIIHRRQVARSEVEALACYFITAGWPVVIATPNGHLASGLRVPSSPHLRVIDFKGRSVPLNPAKPTDKKAPTEVTKSDHPFKSFLIRYGVFRAPLLWHRLRRDLRLAQHLIAELNPLCLFVADDRAPQPEMCFLRAAKNAEIPSILFPYASSSLESDIYIRGSRTDCDLNSGMARPLKHWLAHRFPNQVCPREDADLLFFGTWDTLALAAAGLSDTNPWVLGGGECSAVTVMGQIDARALLQAGLPPEKVHVTGQASLDALHIAPERLSELRATLGRRYGIDATKPWIICAVPHIAEHNACPWDQHMDNMRALFQSMSECGCEVLLSLHPKSHRETYLKAADNVGAIILNDPLIEVLPFSDIFVATFSSTVRWAAMLGIPTVIVDFTDLNYRMYDYLTALSVVRDPKKLKEVLAPLTQDAAYRRALGAALKRDASVTGVLDGQACRRLYDIALSLSGQIRRPDPRH